MSHVRPQTTLKAGLEAIQAEAGGVVEIIVVTPPDALFYLEAAAAGSRNASQILSAIASAGAKIDAAPKRKPALCACCPRQIRKAHGFSFVLAVPANSNPVTALSVAVCSGCAVDPAEIQTKAIRALRKLWPDLRPVTVTHQTGSRA